GIGYRLENYGIKGVQARHRAVCMHLHHERPYRDEAVIRRNREILARIRRTGETRARRGLDELRASIAERRATPPEEGEEPWIERRMASAGSSAWIWVERTSSWVCCRSPAARCWRCGPRRRKRHEAPSSSWTGSRR